MHFTLLVAGALLPGELAGALTASLNLPHLKARLSRATCIERTVASDEMGAHFNWLAANLFAQRTPAPTAPYAYAHLTGAAAPGFVWHADAVHMEAARDHLAVTSLADDPPSVTEARALIATANELALSKGCHLVEIRKRWFLLSDHDWLIDTRPLSSVNETTVGLAGGRDALVWNRLHNEIQMAWHVHDVNTRRETEGRQTVNAVWLHGGGRWKPLPPIGFKQVQSDAAELQGAAHAAGVSIAPASAPVADQALVVSDDAWDARQREDWAAWLRAITAVDRLLAEHSNDAIDLIFSGNTLRIFELRVSDRYKAWRRRTLAHAFSE